MPQVGYICCDGVKRTFADCIEHALVCQCPWTPAVLEAMAEGLPVVASDVTGNRALVVNEENGLLFPVGDKEALIRAALRLIEDQALRNRMGNAGKTRVFNQYSVDQEINAYLGLYEQLLRAANTSARTADAQPALRHG